MENTTLYMSGHRYKPFQITGLMIQQTVQSRDMSFNKCKAKGKGDCCILSNTPFTFFINEFGNGSGFTCNEADSGAVHV
jgi:hypothetical protein